jgi:hypothetical protein
MRESTIPPKRYATEVAHDTRILPVIGEGEEMDEEEEEDPNDLSPLHLESEKTEKKSPVENKKTEKSPVEKIENKKTGKKRAP